jgi:hypothetical protein
MLTEKTVAQKEARPPHRRAGFFEALTQYGPYRRVTGPYRPAALCSMLGICCYISEGGSLWSLYFARGIVQLVALVWLRMGDGEEANFKLQCRSFPSRIDLPCRSIHGRNDRPGRPCPWF